MSAIEPVAVSAAPDAPQLNFRGNAVMVTWTPLILNDTGVWWPASNFQLAAFQAFGDFGAGGTMLLEWSNDGVHAATADDAFGDAVSLSAAGVRVFGQSPLWIRPNVSAGDGTTSLTAMAFLRRQANDGQHG